MQVDARGPRRPGHNFGKQILDDCPGVATWLQVDPDSFDVNVTPQLPADVTTAMEAAQATRRQAERLSGEAATMNRDIARMLVDLGMPLRDVGAILGVSFQRAGQLAGQR